MPVSRPGFNRFVGSIGIICAVLVAIFVFQTSRTRTAAPGKIPGVPPANGLILNSPEDGVVMPIISSADADKIKHGQSVEITVGTGKVIFGPPKQGERK